MKLFKLKKKGKEGVCDAMRCTELKADYAVVGLPWGLGPHNVHLCSLHAAQAQDYVRKHPDEALEVVEPVSLALSDADEGAKVVGWTESGAVSGWLAKVNEFVQGIAFEVSDGSEVLKIVKDHEIGSHEDLVIFSEWARDAKARLKSITQDEKEITLPVSTALKNLKELCRPAKQVWVDVETVIRAHLEAAKLREEEQNRTAMAEAGAAHANGADATAALSRMTHTTDLSGISMKIVWKAVVVDMDLLPDEYVLRTPDEKKLKEYCAGVGIAEIPAPIAGVRFERDVASRISAAK